MADKPVMVWCYRCNSWFGPVQTSDGLKAHCTNCRKNVSVIRYPELHPKSVIAAKGGNTREIQPGDIPEPTVKPTRLETRTDAARAIAPMVADMATVVARERREKISSPRDENPYAAHAPQDAVYCELCQQGNYRPDGQKFGIAVAEVTQIIGGQSVTKMLCKHHAEACQVGFIPPRATRIRALYSKPLPMFNTRRITALGDDFNGER